MKNVTHQTILTLVVVVCLSATSCSDMNYGKPAANGRTEFKDETQARVLLEDGVYPVVLSEEAKPMGDPKANIVELVTIPVEGSVDPAPDNIRVIGQPLLLFRNVSRFDFTFEENECRAIEFQNTDELRAHTRKHVGSRLAVVINNKVITHHKIREAIETDQVRITCCTVGGGDHLHKHVKELKLATDANTRPKVDD